MPNILGMPYRAEYFDDMSHYTMIKTSTFNGIGLPSLALLNSEADEVKQFGYQDFKQRLS